MQIHHHVKHGVLRLASLVKGKIRISLLLLSLILISYFTVTYFLNRAFTQSQAPQQTLGAETLATLNLHPLTSDEFAIVSKDAPKPSGKKVTRSVQLANGQDYTFDADENTAINLIEGNDKTINYIKLTEGVEIHKKDEIKNDGKQKVDPSLTKKLRNKDNIVPVIVQLKVPYNKFYERGQSKEKVASKKAMFDSVKNKVATKFSNKSKIKKNLQIINGIAADIDEQTLLELTENSDVTKIEYDNEVKTTLDTSLDQIHAKDAWNLVDIGGSPLTGAGKLIAIIDTGVDYTHPDLGGCLGVNCKVVGGYDFINNDANPMDDQGHGTHVAATAAGKGLLNGVAPDAKILAVKVLNSGGSGAWSQVISGVNYAVDPNGDGDSSDQVSVASMSLGGTGNPDDAVSKAVDNAIAAGVVVTVAAGNSGSSASTILSPGTARSAVTVAASCKGSQIGSTYCTGGPIASFSSRGPLIWNGVDIQKPDVAAPGVFICAARWGTSFGTAPTCFDGKHVRISGTSMATPHVAGVAALIRQAYPTYTPAQVKQLLKSSAHSLGVTANDQGAGEVDVKAAIPMSSKLTVNPAPWTVSSDPTKKLSITEQSFTITSKDSSISSLSVQNSTSVTGVSVTFSKTTLQVANNATDTLGMTLTVDNDKAKPGNYLLYINFLKDGTTISVLPVYLTVKPTMTISSTALDYGIDNPSLSSWTSDTKTLTVTNLRTDTPQSLAVTASTYATGISFQTPSSVTVPSGSSEIVNTKFVVDNTNAANAVYSGTVTLSNPTNTFTVATKFIKFYVMIVQDPNAADLARSFPVTVFNRAGKVYTDFSNASPKTFYLADPGTYDVIVRYYFPPSKYGDSTVIKEGITVNGPLTTVTTSVTEAKNVVKIIPVDSAGITVSVLGGKQAVYYSNNTPMFETYGGGLSNEYISKISTNYSREYTYFGYQPAIKPHIYSYKLSGIDSDQTLTNSPSDFKTMKVQWTIDQQSGSIKPVLYASMGNLAFASYNSNYSAPLPLTQTIYSMLPAQYEYYVKKINNDSLGSYDTDISTRFWMDGSLKRMTYLKSPLPNMQEQTVHMGLGPSFWAGRIKANKYNLFIDSIVWHPMGYDYGLGFDTPGFLRQDFTSYGYRGYPYTVSFENTVIRSTLMASFGREVSRMGYMQLPKIGIYTFKTEHPYKIKGLDMVGKVQAIFDTRNQDANPPAIKRLYYYTNGARSEIYDPNGQNKVEVELDPIDGSLANVTLSFSKDGQNFEPLTVVNNGSEYSAFLPGTGSGKVTIRITAKDNSNNELSYSFELPQGVSSVPLPSLSPTEIPTPTLTTVPSSTPIAIPTALLSPTAALTPISDNVGPSVTFISPVNGSTVTRNSTITLTVNASDSSGVAKVEYYINGSKKAQCTATSAPYSCVWKVPAKPGTQYQLQAKGYDKVGNTSTTGITVTSN